MSRRGTREGLAILGRGARQLFAQRWVRVVAVLGALAIVVRLALGMLVGLALDRALEPYGLQARWGDLDLALNDGRAELSWLALRPREAERDAPPLLEIEYAVLDLRLRDLLGGRLVVRRAEIDGLDLALARDAEGRWNVEPQVAALLETLARMSAASEDAQTEEPPASLSLESPVGVEALRLQHLRLAIEDRAPDPPRSFALEASLRLSSLGTSERPARFSAVVRGGELLSGASLDGLARWEEGALVVECDARAGGLRPAALAPYLALLGLAPACSTIEAQLAAELRLEPIVDPEEAALPGVRAQEPRLRRALAGALALRSVSLRADGRDALALGSLDVELGAASARGVRVTKVELSGLAGELVIAPDGALVLGGFELMPSRTELEPVSTPGAVLTAFVALGAPDDLPHWIALFGRADPEAFPWRLERLSVRDAQLALRDLRFEPAVELPLSVHDFEIESLVHDPRREPEATHVTLSATLAGVFDELRVDARVLPFAPRRSLALELHLEGLGLAAAQPYLESAGLSRVLERGSFGLELEAEATTDADGRTRGWIEAKELALVETGELFGLRSLAVREIEAEPQPPRLRLGSIEVGGPRLLLVRDPLEGIVALGLRAGGAAAARSMAAPDAALAPAAAAPPPAPVSAPTPGPVPLIEIGHLAWTNGRIALQDESVDPPLEIALEEIELTLDELALGGDPALPPAPPATLRASLTAPGVAERLALEGTLSSQRGALDLEASLALEGRGLRGALLARYLRPFGVEPLLEDGRFSALVSARVREDERGITASASLDGLELAEGERVLAALESLRFEELRVEGERLSIADVALVRPRIVLAREAEGALRTSGLRLVPLAEAPESASREPASLALPRLPALAIGRLTVEDLRLAYEDATFEPTLALEAGLDLELANLDTRAGTGNLDLRLAVPGVVQSAQVLGSLRLQEEQERVNLAVELHGLRAGPLAPLLPPGVELVGDGENVWTRFNLSASDAPEGGIRGGAQLEHLIVSSGKAEDAWLVVPGQFIDSPGATFHVERFDPVAGALALGPTTLEGLRVAARIEQDGALRLGGLRIAPPAREPPSGADDAVEPGRAPRLALSTIDLGRVHLQLARLELVDERLGPDARPLVLHGTLDLHGPVKLDSAGLLRPELEGREPLTLRVRAGVEGLLESLAIEGELAPFAERPTLALALEGRGLRTQGLIELVPALAPLVAGTLVDGSLGGRLEAELDVRRTRPTDLGLERPFGLRLALSELALRDGPPEVDETRVLLGLEAFEVNAPRIDLARGSVHVAELSLRTPRALVRRTERGIEVAGLAIDPTAKAAASPDEASTARSEEPRAIEASARAAQPSAASSQSPAGAHEPAVDDTRDLRIDRVEVEGLALEVVDETLAPPLALFFDQLDLELSRFSTRAVRQGRPLQLAARVGTAPLAESGRPLFADLALAGRLALAPAPEGWVQLRLEALELPPLSRVTAAQGLELEDGALDLDLELRLKAGRDGRARAHLVFTDLDVRELEGGVLESLFSVPVSLDVALLLLRGPDGTHRFTLHFPLDPDKISAGTIASAGAGAMAEVLASALAGAPFKLLGAILPGGGPEPRETLVLDFAPASCELDAAERATLDELAESLARNRALIVRLRHELCAADRERAERLANPAPAECLELVRGLRQRKAELAREQDAHARRARALLAIDAPESQAAGADLRRIGRELEALERALDRVLEILRADSPRQRERRTRTAANALAEARLSLLEDSLRRALAPGDAARVERRPTRPVAHEGLERGRVVIEVVRR